MERGIKSLPALARIKVEDSSRGEVDKNLLSRLIGRIFIALTRFTSK